jgi:putative membrane protein
MTSKHDPLSCFLYRQRYLVLILLTVFGFFWSGISPHNRWHWIGEVAPNLAGLILLWSTFKKFRFSYFTYLVIFIASWFLFVGAKYTFSRVPYFFELTHWMGFQRNNFDKVGHFIQGVVPVLVSIELFSRKKWVVKSWMGFLAFCVAMTTASVYELIEYFACVVAGKNIETFTGTQGFIWDAQNDVFAAMLGALFTVFLFRKIHYKLLKKEFPDEAIED